MFLKTKQQKNLFRAPGRRMGLVRHTGRVRVRRGERQEECVMRQERRGGGAQGVSI